VAATVSYDSATRTATLDPTATLAADTVYTATLTGGTAAIRDLAGNPFSTMVWSFLTGPRPTITATSPPAGATGAPRTGNITVTFSEAVTGVSTSTLVLSPTATATAVAAVVTRNGTTNQWILDPTATLAASTQYTVRVTGGAAAVRDAAGNPVNSASWTFTTGTA
jgi:hypothetical protein